MVHKNVRSSSMKRKRSCKSLFSCLADDQSMKAYNLTLTKYNSIMFLFQVYSDALDAIIKTCSTAPLPPSPLCPDKIAAAQAKVDEQKAIASKQWVQVRRNPSVCFLPPLCFSVSLSLSLSSVVRFFTPLA